MATAAGATSPGRSPGAGRGRRQLRIRHWPRPRRTAARPHRGRGGRRRERCATPSPEAAAAAKKVLVVAAKAAAAATKAAAAATVAAVVVAAAEAAAAAAARDAGGGAGVLSCLTTSCLFPSLQLWLVHGWLDMLFKLRTARRLSTPVVRNTAFLNRYLLQEPLAICPTIFESPSQKYNSDFVHACITGVSLYSIAKQMTAYGVRMGRNQNCQNWDADIGILKSNRSAVMLCGQAVRCQLVLDSGFRNSESESLASLPTPGHGPTPGHSRRAR